MLEKERQQIDQIDQQIVELYEKRLNLVIEVAKKKLESGKEVLDSSREAQVLAKVTGYLNDTSLEDDIRRLYAVVLEDSKNRQREYIEGQES